MLQRMKCGCQWVGYLDSYVLSRAATCGDTHFEPRAKPEPTTTSLEQTAMGMADYFDTDIGDSDEMSHLKALISYFEATHRSGLAEAIRKGREV